MTLSLAVASWTRKVIASVRGSVVGLICERRVRDEFRSYAKYDSELEFVTLSGCSFGCDIAHQAALELQELGVPVRLVLFDSCLTRPPASDLVGYGGMEWLGGRAEVALLLARLIGDRNWADDEYRRFVTKVPSKRNSEELVMSAFWNTALARGVGKADWLQRVDALGAIYDKLYELTVDFVPDEVFKGDVDFVVNTAALLPTSLELQALALDLGYLV